MHDLLDSTPHPLDLYRLAVQHPLAEVAFVEHAWALIQDNTSEPMLLREDFAGTCAVASAWVTSDPNRQAMAIELDPPTASWAARHFNHPDLHIVPADVMQVPEPAVDVTLALNFSILIYHCEEHLLAYLKHSLAGLLPGGMLILDVFGGRGVDKPSLQSRRIEPDENGFAPFIYQWEQLGLDAESGRIDCRIHFELEGGKRLENAFVYEWRLWSPGQIIDLARQAGFETAAFWWNTPTEPGRYRPVQEEPTDEDWVGYVVCQSPG